jgi:hypothetical protein
MTSNEFEFLNQSLARMAAAADEAQRMLEKIAKAETNARRHGTLWRWHNSLRDAALGLKHALAGAPTLTATP